MGPALYGPSTSPSAAAAPAATAAAFFADLRFARAAAEGGFSGAAVHRTRTPGLSYGPVHTGRTAKYAAEYELRPGLPDLSNVKHAAKHSPGVPPTQAEHRRCTYPPNDRRRSVSTPTAASSGSTGVLTLDLLPPLAAADLTSRHKQYQPSHDNSR
jgi:hypothetical protein